jgi:hypothetical protein
MSTSWHGTGPAYPQVFQKFDRSRLEQSVQKRTYLNLVSDIFLDTGKHTPRPQRENLLEGRKQQGRKPKHMIIDNGTEFTSQVLDRCAYENEVPAALHHAGPADGEWLHRKLQRQVPVQCHQYGLPLVAGEIRHDIGVIFVQRGVASFEQRLIGVAQRQGFLVHVQH